MSTRLFSEDPIGGKRVLFHYDYDSVQIVFETQHDVEPILDANNLIRDSMDERANWKGEWHRVASIPLPLYFDLKRKGIVKDPADFKRWLNDPDNRFFRTRPGRV
jgi:hypothetical protein